MLGRGQVKKINSTDHENTSDCACAVSKGKLAETASAANSAAATIHIPRWGGAQSKDARPCNATRVA